MTIQVRKTLSLPLFLACVIFSTNLHADELSDIFKGVLSGYLEKKAEEAGLDIDGLGNGAGTARKVSLTFIGAQAPDVEVYESLHQSQRPSNTPPPTSNETAAERACFAMVQGKIAWNDAGNKRWSAVNVKKLCKGVTVVAAPPQCFSNAISRGSTWGERPHHKMAWGLATQLCAKATSAMAPLRCVKTKLSNRSTLKNAVNACDASVTTRPTRTTPTRTNPPQRTSPKGNTVAEIRCYDLVQNKIAWNLAGNKSWSNSNVKKLCKSARVPAAPGACFDAAIRRPHLWGKTSRIKMSWGKAIQLCAKTDHATRPLSCVKTQLGRRQTLANAVNVCDADPSTRSVAVRTNPSSTQGLKENECYGYVQGRIAWDAAGRNKKWAKNNVKRLCKGTKSKYSPGNCFSYAMHKGSSWGKRSRHRMTWGKAIDLCEGSDNAQSTTKCFKQQIAAGRTVDQAVKRCDR